MFTVDVDRTVTMLEGALIWDSHFDANGSKWYIGENVYDVFNRLNSQLPEGQMPHFLKPLEAILAGQVSEDIQEHEMGEFGVLFDTRGRLHFAWALLLTQQ